MGTVILVKVWTMAKELVVKPEMQLDEIYTRFRTPVPAEELKNFLPNQENSNTKNNTK